jgi:hypothetical protein
VAADGRTRMIEIDRHRVLLSRSVGGVYMRLNLPLSSFLGVAVRVAAQGESDDTVAIVLEHRDADLSVPLSVTTDTENVVADWQLWGKVLCRKLLVADSDGTLREPFATLGGVALGLPRARRPRRSALRQRRPKMYRRRVCSRKMDDMNIHRGEREIIARN